MVWTVSSLTGNHGFYFWAKVQESLTNIGHVPTGKTQIGRVIGILIILIGDSTGRQMMYGIHVLIDITETHPKGRRSSNLMPLSAGRTRARTIHLHRLEDQPHQQRTLDSCSLLGEHILDEFIADPDDHDIIGT